MGYLFAIAASDIGMGEAFGNMIVEIGRASCRERV